MKQKNLCLPDRMVFDKKFYCKEKSQGEDENRLILDNIWVLTILNMVRK